MLTADGCDDFCAIFECEVKCRVCLHCKLGGIMTKLELFSVELNVGV